MQGPCTHTPRRLPYSHAWHTAPLASGAATSGTSAAQQTYTSHIVQISPQRQLVRHHVVVDDHEGFQFGQDTLSPAKWSALHTHAAQYKARKQSYANRDARKRRAGVGLTS